MSNRQTEEDSLQKALSPIVNKLIDKNYEDSQEKIAMQMAPLIGSAIREQIKSHKDDVVDALYPVLGNIISRYVTKTLEEMLSKINDQIQNGLSIKALKRKMMAKIKGVSESELLLNENATANIRALLLIHKETGIVLAHSQNPNYPLNEPEMLASMMSAIRSFVNDWIEQSGDTQELGEIEYGGNKIILEASGYSYLAVIVQGSAYKATYDKIRETQERIVLKYGDTIRKFDGNLEKFANIEIYKEISMLLSEDENKEKKKTHPLLFLIPLLLLSWGGYFYYMDYHDKYVSQKAMQLFEKTPQLTLFKIQANTKNDTTTLSGIVPSLYHKNLASNVLKNSSNIQKISNELIVVDVLQDPMQISANIAYLLRGLNAQDGVNLTYSYDYNLLSIKGEVWNEVLKQDMIKEIEKMALVAETKYEINILPPKLYKRIYFDKSLTELTPFAQAELIKALAILKNLDSSFDVIVSAYSDQIGSTERNKLLSKARISNVIKFLQQQGGIRNNFISLIYDTPPEGINLQKEPEKARCVVISYKESRK